MERFRQRPGVKRVAVGMIALFALLLQGFFIAPAAAFDPLGGITCAQDGSRSGTPAGEHHHHGLCCILGCAACGIAAIGGGIRNRGFPVAASFAHGLCGAAGRRDARAAQQPELFRARSSASPLSAPFRPVFRTGVEILSQQPRY
ncbi:MAG: hypothetical protein ACR2KT_05450 [Methylocella sp.]